MRRTLPFLLIALMSFGATRLAVSVLGSDRAMFHAVPREPLVSRRASSFLSPNLSDVHGIHTSPMPCRQVRVVYAGSVQPASRTCPGGL